MHSGLAAFIRSPAYADSLVTNKKDAIIRVFFYAKTAQPTYHPPNNNPQI
jgi:hypothetical protein